MDETREHIRELLDYLGMERCWLLEQMRGLPWPRPPDAQAWFDAAAAANARTTHNAERMLAELQQKEIQHGKA